MHTVALAVHVAAGTTGLVLGPVIMFAPKRGGSVHTKLGEAYHWVFLVLFISAVALAILDPDVWWLGLVGAFSYSFALRGYLAAKRRRPGWVLAHVSGQGGSYIAMTTALLVVNWNAVSNFNSPVSILPWLLPTIIGSPIIAWVSSQIAMGKRPKAWAQRRASASGALSSGQPVRS